MRIVGRALSVIVLTALLGTPFGGTARAGDDPFDELASMDDVDELREDLAYIAQQLARGKHASKSGRVTLCARVAEDVRKRRVAELAAMLERGADTLIDVGFEPAGRYRSLIVVEVPRRGPGPGVVVAADRRAVLVRTGTRSSSRTRRPLPTLPVRTDGPVVERDVITTSDRLRLALWERAQSGGGGGGSDSLAHVFARHLMH